MRIKFLGTGGARFVVAKQLRASGGVFIEDRGERVILDPGPGSLVRMANSRPRIDPSSIDAIILTHIHLDHSNDVNIVADAMTQGGFNKRGYLFAPHQAIYSEDRVVLNHTLNILERVVSLEERKRYRLRNIEFESSIRHDHEVETYGVRFLLKDKKVGFLVDTAPKEEVFEDYKGCEVLIVNVVLYERPKWVIKHLCLEDIDLLVGIINPKLLVLTHFGMTMLNKKPWKDEDRFSERWGVEVKFAYDGMSLEV